MTRLTRLDSELLYTLWLSEFGGRKDGLLYKEAHEGTNKRYRCTFESVKKSLQRMQNRDDQFALVRSWEAPEQIAEPGNESQHGGSGRRPNLWVLEPKHLVTLPVTALILKVAHKWPHTCINGEHFMASLNEFGISDDVFLERRSFLLDNEYMGTTDNGTLFYNIEERTMAEIDYIRRIALHFQNPSTEAIPEEIDWPPVPPKFE